MTAQPPPPDNGVSATPDVAAAPASPPPRVKPALFELRSDLPRWQVVLFGLVCIAVCFGIWGLLTWGAPEERVLSPGIVPSPRETFADFPDLWFERALTRNTLASLQRVGLGFGLAALIGVPLGILCGCFRGLEAFFAPLTIMGRNIPIAALIPLSFSLFGIGEFQKIMFLFLACVAFVMSDSAMAVNEVSSRYIDTAYTLGANRRQIIFKVLVPLSLPSIFNSLRLLFGLAFGYIMLAEVIQFGNTAGGLGSIINRAQGRGGHQAHILLVLMIIPLIALAIDRLLWRIQRGLFPYQYGGRGLLHQLVKAVLRTGEAATAWIRPSREQA